MGALVLSRQVDRKLDVREHRLDSAVLLLDAEGECDVLDADTLEIDFALVGAALGVLQMSVCGGHKDRRNHKHEPQKRAPQLERAGIVMVTCGRPAAPRYPALSLRACLLVRLEQMR